MKKIPEKKFANDEVGRDEREVNISRRNFLNQAGAATVGGLVVAAGSSLIPRGEAKAATAPEAPPLPWKYAKLDPMEAGKRGYKNYLEKGG